jgi:hypothetical protein
VKFRNRGTHRDWKEGERDRGSGTKAGERQSGKVRKRHLKRETVSDTERVKGRERERKVVKSANALKEALSEYL